ncbi:MAG TPA: FAD/NAD(P)-binding protein [Candidatus Corynebacterium gallistercoris]|uniref:FAD/NAD(P)-binding protein n=1 Tax=Candidatus Corynebacterium gallistercoris TaxID=2838530 RepID=A0A9D1RY17_9CORY|nr:FAD/NAD(P)-binding protein [Candidatus Corynebacterium gallistercoris]
MIVGIVGGGPRALWAVELVSFLVRRHPTPPTIHLRVWDPHGLGAGRVYRTDQPVQWRLNAPARIVSTGLGELPEWMAAHSEERVQKWARENFPPRAIVGEFLAASWAHAVNTLPETVTVEHIPARVGSVDEALGQVDHLLIATGHASEWEGAWEGALKPYALDPDGGLAVDSVPAGARVAVRGAALTFIDVALALTERRGGVFTPDRTAASGLRYHPSGKEPALISAFSRSGRFMEVKPEPGSVLHNLPIASEELLAEQIRQAGDLRGITGAVEEASVLLLDLVNSPDLAAEVAQVLEGKDTSTLQESLDLVRGRRAPGAAWAVGEAFRRLYPAIVQRVSYAEVPGFWKLSRTLERVAFGPPKVTSARILALMEAGLVNPIIGNEPDPHADVHVDAVIPPPGVQPGTLTAELVQRGILGRRADGSLDIAPGGAVPGGEGTQHPNLSVIGRDAEPTVLGLDTLNRTMHPELPEWAERIVDQASKRN